VGKAKVRYDTRAEAKAFARRQYGAYARCLCVYRCPDCGYFHVGHYPESLERRKELRDAHRVA
jgi:hypothetical protein